MPVEAPPTTANCMVALEQAMKASPVDVFWFQERWKIYVRHTAGIREWLGAEATGGRQAAPRVALVGRRAGSVAAARGMDCIRM